MSTEVNGWSRQQVACEVNRQIALLADSLESVKHGPLGFFCECGCWSVVAADVAAYTAAGGIWCDGHRPASGESAEPSAAAV